MSVDSTTSASSASQRVGVVCALFAFLSWGLLALFWRQLRHVASTELLAHRAVWSMLCFVLLVAATRKFADVRKVFASKRSFLSIAASAFLIGSNWLVFVYAIQTDRLLHASFGYFINPMVNVVCGVLFFSEVIGRGQRAALVLVVLGILVRASDIDDFPWISLYLAVSFSLYGIIRKKVSVDAMVGTATETFMMAPFALAYLIDLWRQGSLHFLQHGPVDNALLVATGIVTLVPLVLFSAAARRIPLTWLGQIQYLAPTLQFLVAVLFLGETSSAITWVGFSLVWLGLAASMAFAYRKAAKSGRVASHP